MDYIKRSIVNEQYNWYSDIFLLIVSIKCFVFLCLIKVINLIVLFKNMYAKNNKTNEFASINDQNTLKTY